MMELGINAAKEKFAATRSEFSLSLPQNLRLCCHACIWKRLRSREPLVANGPLGPYGRCLSHAESSSHLTMPDRMVVAKPPKPRAPPRPIGVPCSADFEPRRSSRVQNMPAPVYDTDRIFRSMEGEEKR